MRAWLGIVCLLLLTGVPPVVLAAFFGDLAEWRSWRLLVRLGRRLRPARAPLAEVVPVRRPIETVGADLHRLHASFHREGLRFAKYEGCRQAYERVLAEAADMIDLTHLLAVLPPGDERDRERARVEAHLERAGMLRRRHAA